MAADKLPQALCATEDDIQLLLAAQCHLGTKNCDKTMEPYVYKRRADGESSWHLEDFGWGGDGRGFRASVSGGGRARDHGASVERVEDGSTGMIR